jgi:hypothetical protein
MPPPLLLFSTRFLLLHINEKILAEIKNKVGD